MKVGFMNFYTIVIVSLLLVISVLLYFVFMKKESMFISHKVGWLAYQDALKVTAIEVTPLGDSSDVKVNRKQDILLKVEGALTQANSDWKPYVKYLHFNEKWVRIAPSDYQCLITIEPVVDVKKEKGTKGGDVPFSFEVKISVNMGGWGKNNFTFQAGEKKALLNVNLDK